MTQYRIDDIHRIEVAEAKSGTLEVRFLEKMTDRWVQLGPRENWSSINDIKWYYGIDQ